MAALDSPRTMSPLDEIRRRLLHMQQRDLETRQRLLDDGTLPLPLCEIS